MRIEQRHIDAAVAWLALPSSDDKHAPTAEQLDALQKMKDTLLEVTLPEDRHKSGMYTAARVLEHAFNCTVADRDGWKVTAAQNSDTCIEISKDLKAAQNRIAELEEMVKLHVRSGAVWAEEMQKSQTREVDPSVAVLTRAEAQAVVTFVRSVAFCEAVGGKLRDRLPALYTAIDKCDGLLRSIPEHDDNQAVS